MIEKLKLKSDLIYKKLIVLLALAGGSGAYIVKFYERGEYGILIFFLIVFILAAIGISINYYEINRMKRELDHEE